MFLTRIRIQTQSQVLMSTQIQNLNWEYKYLNANVQHEI